MNQPGAPQPYNQQPYGYHPPGGFLQRPKAAATASTLGIISGVLGILGALLTFILTANTQNEVAKVRSRINPDTLAQVTAILNGLYFVAAVVIIIAIILLVSGIQFRTGKGYTLLRTGAIAQIVLAAVDLLLPLAMSGALNTSSNNTSSFVGVAIRLGLAIAILMNLSKPEVKQWKDAKS